MDKTLALFGALLVAVSADAAVAARATLVGQRLDRSAAGGPLLICEYAGSQAKFEILSQNGKCARYIEVQ